MWFAVETWAPDYGSPNGDGMLAVSDAQVELAVEVHPDEWAPRDPSSDVRPPEQVLFIDGVQRVDARLWVTPPQSHGSNGNGQSAHGDSSPRLGVCASWAAGAVRCGQTAEIVAAEVRRGVLCPLDDLEPIVTRHGTYEPRTVPLARNGSDPIQEAIGQARGDLEGRVAVEVARSQPADLVVVDGPLGDRRHIPGAVGYVKAHHVSYLPPRQQAVVGRLKAGQRTPLFRIGDRRFRYSWYMRLPGPGAGPYGDQMPLPHTQWGIVRCEAEGELPLVEAVACADRVTAALPRFATRPHQDARAPQNLHPIAGLERRLRHQLGSAALLERALRLAAVAN
jgi:hypothetical protein